MNAAANTSTPSTFAAFAPNRPLAWLACAAVVVGVGCSGAEDNNAPESNTTANNTTANNTTANNTTANNTNANNTTQTTGPMVTFTLMPIDSTTGMLLDAEICVRGTDNCAMGTAEGVSIEVPSDTDLAVSLTSDGFVTANWFVNLAQDTTYNTPLVPAANIVALRGAFGFADDASKGHVFFQAQDSTSGIGGVALSLAPASFELVLYNGANGPDPALTETVFGNGAFINVDGGSYEMTGAHATLNCGPPAGHQQGGAEGALKFEVVGGEATYGFVACQ